MNLRLLASIVLFWAGLVHISLAATTPSTTRTTTTTSSTRSTTTTTRSSSTTATTTTRTSSTSTTSVSLPSGTACLSTGLSRYVGYRVSEARPGSCNIDALATAELNRTDNLWRFYQTSSNGTKAYYSYYPSQSSCGEVGQMRFVLGGNSTLTQWKPQCANTTMVPTYAGTPLYSIGVSFGSALLAVSSRSKAVLDCYKKSLSLQTYDDLYYVFLPTAVNQCS